MSSGHGWTGRVDAERGQGKGHREASGELRTASRGPSRSRGSLTTAWLRPREDGFSDPAWCPFHTLPLLCSGDLWLHTPIAPQPRSGLEYTIPASRPSPEQARGEAERWTRGGAVGQPQART